MTFTTLSSETLQIVCFLPEADWSKSISISHSFAGDVTEGLSNREGRRPRAEQQMLSAGVMLTLAGDEAQELRNTLATLGKSWVGVPLWVDKFIGADYAGRIYDARKLIDLTISSIVSASSTLDATHIYAPLLVGHITSLPDIEPINGTLAQCRFTLTEDSPWDYRIGISTTATAGVWPSSLLPNWSSPPTETPVSGLTFDGIGQQRERVIGNEEAAFRWTSKAGFTLLSKAEIATLLAFFVASRGQWQSFTAPFWYKPGTATANAPHSSTMRFGESVLTLDYETPEIANVQIKLSEVPWEITGTSGETPQQPGRIYLYQITHKLPTPHVYRFTNCWRPLTRTGDGTYAPAPMEHENIKGGLDLSSENITLNSFVFDGNPLAMFSPNILEASVELRVYEIESEPLNADLASQVWFGAIASAPQTGRKYAAECKWLGGILDREGPGVFVGPSCNTYFMSPWCGHLNASFEKTGTLLSSLGCIVVVATSDSAAANTYSPGKLCAGAGDAWESRSVVSSTPVTGGQQLTLDRPLRQAATGQSVSYYRSCDRQVATCRSLDPSGWKARFRGHPYLPSVALTLPATSTRTGGKK
jgi:hypothetical protein